MRSAELRKWNNQNLEHQINFHTTYTRPSQETSRISWAILLGVFLIQLSVPSVVASQGVVIAHLLQQTSKNTFGTALLPPFVLVATWGFLTPWFRELGLRHRGREGRLVAGCGALLLAMSLAASALSTDPTLRIITFGIIGGAGCGLASSQCDTQLSLHSRSRDLILGHTVISIAQALAHFLGPLIVVGLLAGYGVSGASLVQAALVLHGLAGALLLRAKSRSQAPRDQELQLIGYSSVPQHEDDLEMTSKGQSDDNDDDDGRIMTDKGVEIMPQILEESEESSDDEGVEQASVLTNRMSIRISSARDSWCPVAPLDIYLPSPEDSTVKGTSPKLLLTPSSLSRVNNSVFDFDHSHCCQSCGSWTSSAIRKAWRSICTGAEDIRETCRPSIFPAILITASVRTVPLSVASLMPSLAQYSLDLPRHEAAFSMAVVGFGWLCAAVCAPCLMTPKARKHTPIVYAIASCASSLGLFMISEAVSHDRMTLGCTVVGIAHGITLPCFPVVLKQLCSGVDDLTSRTQALLDRGASLLMLTAGITASLLCQSIWSYGYILSAVGALQGCLGAAWLAWELANKFKLCFIKCKNITSQGVQTSSSGLQTNSSSIIS